MKRGAVLASAAAAWIMVLRPGASRPVHAGGFAAWIGALAMVPLQWLAYHFTLERRTA